MFWGCFCRNKDSIQYCISICLRKHSLTHSLTQLLIHFQWTHYFGLYQSESGANPRSTEYEGENTLEWRPIHCKASCTFTNLFSPGANYLANLHLFLWRCEKTGEPGGTHINTVRTCKALQKLWTTAGNSSGLVTLKIWDTTVPAPTPSCLCTCLKSLNREILHQMKLYEMKQYCTL